jgi:outer membrane receptor protein involved in Fe transport
MQFFKYIFVLFLSFSALVLEAQTQGTIYDDLTQEALSGAVVECNGQVATTDHQGRFSFEKAFEPNDQLTVTYLGYEPASQPIGTSAALRIALKIKANTTDQVVVTASREAQLRSHSAMAISKISAQLIEDTKATNFYELINKTPGVNMVNLGNEQHMMAIRQPFTTNSYFLYLEDGIPVRPMGVFNHNAMIEMNVFTTSGVEVVKGPVSSIYGPEAVGGAINVLSHKPTAMPTAKLGIQFDNFGYRRIQASGGSSIGKKLGFYVGGFVSQQREGWQVRTDFDKYSFNARLDYDLNAKTKLIVSGSHNNYDSQTGGSVDSVAYYNRSYTSSTNFTYRKVVATRARATIEHKRNANSESLFTLFYRKNSIAQNPSYSIRWSSGSTTATGEINDNAFDSYGAIMQHSERFKFLNSKLLGGINLDYSPNTYNAYRIDLTATLRPGGRSVETFNFVKERPDIKLADYNARIFNTGAYAQYEINPIAPLRLIAGVRFDRMSFDYTNYLDNTTGSKSYQQLTPKLGLTYDFGKGIGAYANVAQGFSPPGLSAIFRKRTNPQPGQDLFYYNLTPALFNNYEVGGWASLLNNKLSIDVSFYQMDGTNELLSIRLPDGSTNSESAGKTLHRGIEYGITYRPINDLNLRFSGTNALHRFEEFELSQFTTDVVKNVNGKIMPSAPSFIANAEIIYKPLFIKGLRLNLEWQRMSSYYQNQINTVEYNDPTLFGLSGVSLINVRAGYQWKGIELFVNLLNATNELYANNVTRGNRSTNTSNFTPAAPRTFVFGIQYNFKK